MEGGEITRNERKFHGKRGNSIEGGEIPWKDRTSHGKRGNCLEGQNNSCKERRIHVMRENITGNPVKGEETLLEDKHVLRKLEGQETEGTPDNQLLRQVSQLWFTIQVTNHLAKCSTSSNVMFQTYFLIKKKTFCYP